MAAIFWFRRDLRLEDNAGLYHALKQTNEVVPVFIFDKNILNKLEDKTDARVTFIHREITRIQNELRGLGSDLKVYYGHPEAIWNELLTEYSVSAVYTNHDYEPYAEERDNTVRKILNNKNIPFYTYKDQCIFEKDEV
jgi:deoxyribodipyrimidine photo-lyase